MKKKIILLGISLFLIVLLSVNVYLGKGKSDNTLSPLLLQNVEALSSIENGDWIYCFMEGSIVCPITQEKVYTYRYYGVDEEGELY